MAGREGLVKIDNPEFLRTGKLPDCDYGDGWQDSAAFWRMIGEPFYAEFEKRSKRALSMNVFWKSDQYGNLRVDEQDPARNLLVNMHNVNHVTTHFVCKPRPGKTPFMNESEDKIKEGEPYDITYAYIILRMLVDGGRSKLDLLSRHVVGIELPPRISVWRVDWKYISDTVTPDRGKFLALIADEDMMPGFERFKTAFPTEAEELLTATGTKIEDQAPSRWRAGIVKK